MQVSRTSTPQSRSRSSTGSSNSSDTAMLDAPPQSPSRPVRLRNPSYSAPSAATTRAVTSDPTFSLLFSLPRELRDRVYYHALVSPLPFWWPSRRKAKHDVVPSLLRTSKQVYGEALPVLYKENKFLFWHPSDCNIFRVVASPQSRGITSVYLTIREKDVRIWTAYLGSKTIERSLKYDFPKLRTLYLFMRCGLNERLGQLWAQGQAPAGGQNPAGLQATISLQVTTVQSALHQQIAAVHAQHQTSSPESAQNGASRATRPQSPGNQVPQIPPPPPPIPPFAQFAQGGGHHHHQQPHGHGHGHGHHHHHHHHQPIPVPPPAPLQPPTAAGAGAGAHQPLTSLSHPPTFLRHERDMGVESVCLSLQDTLPSSVEVKIVCMMRVPRGELARLIRSHGKDLRVDSKGDARTWWRGLGAIPGASGNTKGLGKEGKRNGAWEVCLEISGYDVSGTEGDEDS